MKGEKLTGKGVIAGEEEEDEEDANTAPYKDLDLDKVNKEMEEFAVKVPDFAKSATISAHSKML